MNLSNIAQKTGRMLSDNAPTILTALGVAGSLSTSWLVAKATWQAHDDITEKEVVTNSRLDARERFELVWKLYIPAAGSGLLTISAIVLANRVSSKREAALMAGFALAERSIDEYRAKVVEKIGEKEEKKIREEIKADKIAANPPNGVIVVNGNGLQLCHEALTNTYFFSNMEKLRKAENDTNSIIYAQDHATLANFYEKVGAKELKSSMEGDFGWNHERRLELGFDSILVQEGPYAGYTALSFDYLKEPVPQPWKYNKGG